MSNVAGTPEAGGWTMREVKRIIRGLAGLNFVYEFCFIPCTFMFTRIYLEVSTWWKSPHHMITVRSQDWTVTLLPIHNQDSILAEITGIAAADLVHEFLSMLMAGSPIPRGETIRVAAKDEL